MSSSSYYDEEVYSEDDDDSYYYQCNEDELIDDCIDTSAEKSRKNIEFFDYECISVEQAKEFIQSKIENLSGAVRVRFAHYILK